MLSLQNLLLQYLLNYKYKKIIYVSLIKYIDSRVSYNLIYGLIFCNSHKIIMRNLVTIGLQFEEMLDIHLIPQSKMNNNNNLFFKSLFLKSQFMESYPNTNPCRSYIIINSSLLNNLLRVEMIQDQSMINVISNLCQIGYMIIMYGNESVQYHLDIIDNIKKKWLVQFKFPNIQAIIVCKSINQKQQKSLLRWKKYGVIIFENCYNRIQNILELINKYFLFSRLLKNYVICTQTEQSNIDNLQFYKIKVCQFGLAKIFKDILQQIRYPNITRQILQQDLDINIKSLFNHRNLKTINQYSTFYNKIQNQPFINQQNPYKFALNQELLIQKSLKISNKHTILNKSASYYKVTKYILDHIIKQNCHFLPYQITKSQLVCNCLKEQFKQNTQLYNQMMHVILKSRTDRSIQKSAAVAITVLNIVGVKFSGMDLSDISIPYAELSNGYFESTNLSDSNLQNVKFDKCYLVSTKFNRADMRGVSFGFLQIPIKNQIVSLDFDYQRKQIAVAYSNVMSIFDSRNTKKLKQWTNSNKLSLIKYSTGYKILISIDSANLIKLWDTENGHLLNTLNNSHNKIKDLCLQNNEVSIAILQQDNIIKLWNIQVDQIIEQIRMIPNEEQKIKEKPQSLKNCYSFYSNTNKNEQRISSIKYSHDGKHLLCSYSKVIKMWNISKKTVKTFEGSDDLVKMIDSSPDGQKIAACSQNIIMIWDIQSQIIVKTLNNDRNVFILKYYDINLLITGNGNGIKLWNIQNTQLITTIPSNGYVRWIYYHYDRIISNDIDKSIKIWDNLSKYNYIQKNHSDRITNISCSIDQKLIASGGWDTNIKIWDMQSGDCHKTLIGHSREITCICFCPNKKYIASGSKDLTIRIWDLENGNTIHTLKVFKYYIIFLCYSKDGKSLITVNNSSNISVWDIKKNQFFQQKNQDNLKNQCETACISPDHKTISCGQRDGTVSILDVETGNLMWTIQTNDRHDNTVYSMCYSLDGTKIAYGTYNQGIYIWNIVTRSKMLHISELEYTIVLSVCFSPDVSQLASGSFHSLIQIWNTISGERIKRISGHNFGISALYYCSNGKKLISSGYDSMIKVWNCQNQNHQAQFMNYNCNPKNKFYKLHMLSFNLILNIPHEQRLRVENIEFSQIEADTSIFNILD